MQHLKGASLRKAPGLTHKHWTKLERLAKDKLITKIRKKFYSTGPSGLYYKHTTIVNYASGIVNKLEALLTYDARVVIYDRHVFRVQATVQHSILFCRYVGGED
jgi:hypothetical protein